MTQLRSWGGVRSGVTDPMSEPLPSSKTPLNRPQPEGSDPLEHDPVWDLLDQANRAEAPAYFTLKVMRKIEAMPPPRSWWPFAWQPSGFAWIAPVAASCALLLFAASRLFPPAHPPQTVTAGSATPLVATASPSDLPFVAASSEIDAEVIEVLDQLVAFEDNSAWPNPAAM